jgi:hypothetical protein
MKRAKKANRCPAHCNDCHDPGRRNFLKSTAVLLAGSALGAGCTVLRPQSAPVASFQPQGPASTHVPVVHAAFVRRAGEYGMKWPGQIYDGEAARRRFTEQVLAAASTSRVNLVLRDAPIYTPAEADAWLAEAQATKAEGLLVLLLDRQEHAWPTAAKAADTGIPTVVYSPLGSSFTTNTLPIADRPGCVIFSTDDPRQLDYGVKVLGAGARIRQTRCAVIAGKQRVTRRMRDLGIELQYVPAEEFLEIYNSMPASSEIERAADHYIGQARQVRGATRQDVINGIKSYYVAGEILRREKADAISMDCLGALGKTTVSLPCIAWSRMNDEGIPAACEADVGAIAAHVIVQYLFDRPGFQQDPVADTADDTIIGAHCSCATRLRGFGAKPEPFELIHHHGNRDAVPRTLWPIGERLTCLDVLPAGAAGQEKTELLISAGNVVSNISAPPAGGCVVSVKARFDGGSKVLSFPGFHQLFFLGDKKRELLAFGQLYNIATRVV